MPPTINKIRFAYMNKILKRPVNKKIGPCLCVFAYTGNEDCVSLEK